MSPERYQHRFPSPWWATHPKNRVLLAVLPWRPEGQFSAGLSWPWVSQAASRCISIGSGRLHQLSLSFDAAAATVVATPTPSPIPR
jgi:hypothetical protein